MNKDLSQGPILKTLWLYCLPLLGSIILQQVYNLADSVVAGRFISEAALAAARMGGLPFLILESMIPERR